MAFDLTDFRKTLSQFATGVVVVLMRDTENNLHGVTINSLTSVSLEPPLILFCLKSTFSRAKIFQESSYFSLNILTNAQQNIARHFAGKVVEPSENFAIGEGFQNLPILDKCAAHLYCELEKIIPGGDHEIYLCHVVELAYDLTKRPLIFHQSQFSTTEVIL